MSVLVVGLSHRTAPVPVLERASIRADDLPQGAATSCTAPRRSARCWLLSTCNRIEVYADVARFHPAVAEISGVLARHAGIPVADLGEHLYVHFAEAAAEHMFSVASGLDSMVVGESQILGQLRARLRAGHRGRRRSAPCCTTWPRRRCGSASGCTPRPASTGRARRSSRSRSTGPNGCWGRWTVARADRRRRLDGRAGRRDAAPPRRRATSSSPTAAPERGARLAASLGGRAVGARRAAARDRRRRPGGLLDRSDRAGRRGRRGRRPRRPSARSCSTWRCPATSTPPSARCPASPTSTSTRCAPDGAAVSDAEVRRGRGDRRRRAARLPGRAAARWPSRPTVTALRARANQVDRRRTAPAGRAGCPGSTTWSARRGRRRGAPRGREGAARADRPGEGAGRAAGRRPVRRRRCASCSTSTRPRPSRSPRVRSPVGRR